MQRMKTGRTPSSHGGLSRLKPVELDPLDEYGLPSKGEKRLLNHAKQEAYYSLIAARYLAFCTSAGDGDSLTRALSSLSLAGSAPTTTAPSPTTTSSSPATTKPPSHHHPKKLTKPPPAPATLPPLSTAAAASTSGDLATILSALRKLREALLASRRHDEFAAQAYLFAARLGVLAMRFEAYYPALLHLLRVLGPAGCLTSAESQEAAGYLVLDAACRRGDLAEAYRLRARYLRGGGGQGEGGGKAMADGVAVNGTTSSSSSNKIVDNALRALAEDNWALWNRTRRAADGHRLRIMDWADGEMRERVLKAVARAYLTVGRSFLERQTGARWDELKGACGVGWELEDGGEKVVIRRVGKK